MVEQLSMGKEKIWSFQQDGIQKLKLCVFSSFKAVFVNGLTKLNEFANLPFGAIFFDHEKSLYRGVVRREPLAAHLFV
jgi:hypothetical protein